MENETEIRKNRGNTILLTVLGISTLLVAIVGASFSFFTASLSGTDTVSSIIIKTATIGIVYNDGAAINTTLVPTSSMNATTKTFTISNATIYDARYTMQWQNVVNGFSPATDLVYAISCSTNKTPNPDTPPALLETTMPLTGVTAINGFSNILIPANTVHTCVLSYRFNLTAQNQDVNQGKEFVGSLNIIAESTETP